MLRENQKIILLMTTMTLKLVKLDQSNVCSFDTYVSQELPHFFFFILDWKFNRDDTEIWLALRKKEINGMMLIFKRSIVHLRGTSPAIEALLNKLELEKFEINTEMAHSEIVHEKYRLSGEHELLLMILKRGEENLVSTESIVRLYPERAGEIAELMRCTSPEIWGNMTTDRIEASMNRNLWLGVIVDNRLASVGSTFLMDPVSNINTVATHEDYRNRGYATQVVSALVREILRRNSTALSHVLKDNLPARRVYGKVGFKPYRSYLYGFAELKVTYRA